MRMIKNQSKLNVNVSGIGRFFKRLQHKQCGLKKLYNFGFLGKSINQLSKNGSAIVLCPSYHEGFVYPQGKRKSK